MALIECPECGKEISDKAPACPGCGNPMSYTPPLTIAYPGNVTTLLGLAKTADIAGNTAEAEKYYTQVLEIEPTNFEAWFGKGKSAGWSSTIVHMRLGETVAAFCHAMANCEDNQKASILNSCVEEINKIVVALYNLAHEHMLEFISLDNTWTSYIQQVQQLIDVLDVVSEWDKNNTITYENIVFLCKDNIEGITFKDEFDNNLPKTWHLSPEYEKILREKLDTAVQKIQQLEPEYIPPTIKKESSSPCFVVTATMGSEHHPKVILIRQFRDQWLLHQALGPEFVKLYYKHGPKAADCIRVNKLLRALSYFFIVTPLSWVAQIIIKPKS